MTRRSFEYRPPNREAIRRRLQRLGWSKARFAAYKHDTQELCEYLRSELPLDQDKRNDLADLIDRRIERKAGPGRKPGVIPPPHEITQGYIISVVREKLRRERARNGGRVPHGATKRALVNVCRGLANAGESFDVNEDAVLKELKRNRRRRGPR
jgi:hypothetical protein